MLDTAQLLLIAVIVILTILLLVLGVQTFFILTEFRQTVNKANKLLDDIKSGANIAKIIGALAALFLGKKFGKNFIDIMGNMKTKEEEKILPEKNEESKKTIKRFFRGSKKL